MKKLVVIAMMLAAASAFAAPVDPGNNGIGIYFDTAAQSQCSQAAPYANVSAYLLATNLPATGISGWEMAITTNPASLPAGMNVTLANGALNVLSAPNYNVGIPTVGGVAPDANGVVVLATISTFYLGGPVEFFIGACGVSPSLPGGPVFAQGDNPGILRYLVPASNLNAGGLSTPGPWRVAAINGGTCPVATTNDSWGSVKNLYQ